MADEPRPGTPRQISDAQVEEAVTRTLESAGAATHWSTRALAQQVGLSQSAVVRVVADEDADPTAGGMLVLREEFSC